jgi:PAS domain S-box-containing protein
MKKWNISFAAKISLIYFTIGAIWILLTDKALFSLFPEPEKFAVMQTYKGWFFVIATTIILYELIKNGRAAQKAAEESLLDLFESTSTGVFRSSLQGRYMTVNSAMASIYGFASANEMVETITDISKQIYASTEERNRFAEELLKKGVVEKFETMNIKKDGSVIWTSTKARAVKDKDGNVLYYDGFVTEITKQKNAEIALRDKELQYRLIVEQASDGIIMVDETGKILEANQQICSMVGYSREELLTLSINDLIPKDSPTGESWNLREFASGRANLMEKALQRKDGTLLLVELSMKALPNAMLIGIARNVSNRKIMQEALTRSEQRFRALIENSMDAIALYSVDGRIIFQSPAATHILGYSPGEMLGKNALDFIYEDDKGKTSQAFLQIINNPERNIKLEVRCICKDKSLKWIEVNGSNHLQDPGIEALVTNYRDITERKTYEEALRHSEISYRGLFDTVQDAIYIQDKNGRFLDVNEGAMQMYGYPKDRFIGETVEFLSAPGKNNMKRIAQAFQDAFNGEPQHLEFWGLHNNGTIFPKEVRLYKGVYFGEDVIIAVAQDITTRKQAEEALQKQLRELSVLHSVALTESTARDVDTLIQQITDIISDTLYSDNCGVLLLNQEQDTLVPHYSYRGTDIEKIGESLPATEGISGKVVNARRPIRIDDVSLEPSYFEISRNTRSELCVPIMSGSRLFGVLNVESKKASAFTDRDERLLNTIAGGMANAMERIQLFELEKKRRQEAENLSLATASLANTLDIEDLFDNILSWLQKLAPYDSASIMLDQGESIRLAASRNLPDEFYVGREFPFTEKWRHLAAVRKPLIIEDAQNDPIFEKWEATSYIHGWMAVAMFAQDSLIGFINLDSHAIGTYTDEHATRVQTFANQAATAIAKARLFELEKKRRETAETVRQATTSLTNLLDLPSLQTAILEWMYKIAPYDSASILEIEGGYVRVTATTGLPDPEKVLNLTFPVNNILRNIINETGQTLIIDDCREDPRFERWGDSENIRGWMGVPMISRGQVIGYITFDSRTPNAYTQSDAIAAQTFAQQAATSLENARLYTETRQRLEELEMVSRVSFALRAARDTNEMLPILLNEIQASIGTDAATILLYDHELDTLTPRAASGWLTDMPKTNFKPGEGIIGMVYSSGKTYVSPELIRDPRSDPENIKVFGEGWAGITVPIRTANETIGVITVGIKKPRSVEDHFVRLITTLAEIAGNAIYRSNLYERSEEQIRRLTTLREMDTAITSSLDLRITLNIITEHLLTKMGVSAAAILVFNPESQMLDYLAVSGFQNRETFRSSLSIGDGLAGQILLNRQSIHIKDLGKEMDSINTGLPSDEKFTSYYAIPLFSKGATRGILETYFKETFIPSADWIDFLQTLAGQATIAIDNAQLFENLQRTNQELSLAYDTTLEGWGRLLNCAIRKHRDIRNASPNGPWNWPSKWAFPNLN